MNDTHTTHPARTWIGAGLGLLGLAAVQGCATGALGRQTAVMQSSGAVSSSAGELRAQVNDLAEQLAGSVEATADGIGAVTTDAAVRRRALAFKADAIPAIYAAAYRADPLAAALDVWGLTFQLDHWLADGRGRDLFGAEQALAQAGARGLVTRTSALLQRAATNPEGFERGRRRIDDWARTHPIEYTVSSRASATAVMSELQTEGRDAFASVGVVSVTIENISERLNTYVTQLPKQARWQAELLLSEVAGGQDVEAALEDFRTFGAVARRVDGMLEALPHRLDALGAFANEVVTAERRATADWIDAQRGLAIEFVTAERLALLGAIDANRIAVMDALREELEKALTAVRDERIAAMADIDGTATRTVDAGMNGLMELVDYTLIRLAALLLTLMIAATVLGAVGYRFARRPRDRAGA